MKPTASDIVTKGDLGGQRVQLSLDENSLVHIMTHLAGLYSDKELAVIREISTNAYDANVAAGVSTPIQVSLPNRMSPYFIVKDQGIGMSVDDLINVYAKYGASTKRDSNDVVGMLGFGCKAPLAYTDSFTIVAVKNGVKATAVMSRDETGAGNLQVVDTSTTVEPNGVTVKVSVDNTNIFSDKAREFYRWWKPGSVEIGNYSIRSIYDEKGEWLTDKILLINTYGTDTVVMGNVPYASKNDLYVSEGTRSYNRGSNRGYHFIYFADIGEVNFPPSREAMLYDKLTNATLEQVREDIDANISKLYQDDIDSAKTHTEAVVKHQKWNNIASLNWSYKGTKFDDPKIQPAFNTSVYAKDHRTSVVRSFRHVQNFIGYGGTYSVDHILFVENFPLAKVVRNHTEKIRKFSEDYTEVYFFKEKVGSVWFDGIKTIDWKDLKKIKIAPTGPAVKREERKYDDPTGWRHSLSEVKNAKNVYYEVASDYQWGYRHNEEMAGWKRKLAGYIHSGGDTVVIWLKSNEEEKFLKSVPHAKKLLPVILKEFEDAKATLTEMDKFILAGRSYESITNRLDHFSIDDPEFSKFLLESKTASGSSIRVDNYKNRLKLMYKLKSARVDVPDEVDVTSYKTKDTPVDKYPLLQRISYYGNDPTIKHHWHTYINAYYKENYK